MVRILLNILFMIRDAFQKIAGNIFDKFRDEQTGKVKLLSPKALKTLIITIIFTLALIILIIKLWSPKDQVVGGSDSYVKENRIDNGVKTAAFTENGKIVAGNPLEMGGKGDPLDKLIEVSDTRKENDKINTNTEPTVTDCLNLNDKIKSGTVLSDAERNIAKTCIDKNIAGLTLTEKQAYEKLLSGNISDAEKKLLMKKLNSELDGGSSEEKIADAILDNDPRMKGSDIAYGDRDKKALDAFAKLANGEELTPEEKALIKKYQDLAAKSMPASNNVAGALPEGAVSKEEMARVLANEIAKKEEEKKQIENQLLQSQAQAKEAAKKIAAGMVKDLTEKEQKAIQDVAELNKKYEMLKKEQSDRLNKYNKAKKEAMEAWSQADLKMKQAIVSQTSVDYVYSKGKKKPKQPKIEKREEEKVSYVDIDGQPLQPDRIKLVQLYRQKKMQIDLIKKNIKNPFGDNLMDGESLFDKTNLDKEEILAKDRLAINQVGEGYKIEQSVVWTNKEVKAFNFTPDMKIPAALDSMILLSSKAKNQSIRIKILANIHDPATNKLIVPKGSIAVASVSGSQFDVDTQLLDFTINKISIGSGKTIDVNMNVGSGDGTMGLKGQVYDTRGKYLGGVLITSFMGGALQWFSQQIVSPYVSSTDAASALTGAALGGSAEVAQKIADMYAGDLQNAAKIYYCPKKVPIVLFPN